MTTIEHLNAGGVLPEGLPFPEAVRHGDTLYLSGQLGVAPGTLDLVPGGIAAEARQAMAKVRAILEASGSSMARVVRCTVMLADIGDWAAFNEVYAESFGGDPLPARSGFGCGGLALGARVEVDCIAALGPGGAAAP